MNTGLVLLFLGFLGFSHASAEVTFTPVQSIVMQAPTCGELQAQAQSILNWSKLIYNAAYEMPQCFCSAKSCIMDVAPISPYFVKEMTNYEGGFTPQTAYAGPNCFNAAFVSSQTLPHIGFTHALEATAVLGSSLCTERRLTEPLEPGDILVVRNQADPNFEVHAGVYLNDHLAFSKYGENSLMPYTYGMDVDKSYGVKDEACRRLEGIPVPGDKCFGQPFVNFFKCTPFYSFVSRVLHSSGGLNPAVQEIYAAVSSLDNRISGIAKDDDKIDAQKLGDLQNELRALYAKTEINGADAALNKENAELNRLMRFRVFSLFEQTVRIAVRLHQDEMITAELPKPQL